MKIPAMVRLLLAFAIFAISVQITEAQTPVLRNIIYSPTLLTGRGFTASGVIWSRGINTYLLTAKHVIVTPAGSPTTPILTLTAYSPGRQASQKCVLDIDLDQANKTGELRAHKTHDIALIRLCIDTVISGKEGLRFLQHVNIKAYPDTGLLTATAVTLFESALLSNDAFVLGYPGSIGVPEVPQLDYSQPLIKRGIVAGKNLDKRTLIIDCFTYPGNSGGPVFEIDQINFSTSMRLIGVVSQLIPFQEIWQNRPFGYENREISNSGYTVVEPMDFALELLR